MWTQGGVSLWENTIETHSCFVFLRDPPLISSFFKLHIIIVLVDASCLILFSWCFLVVYCSSFAALSFDGRGGGEQQNGHKFGMMVLVVRWRCRQLWLVSCENASLYVASFLIVVVLVVVDDVVVAVLVTSWWFVSSVCSDGVVLIVRSLLFRVVLVCLFQE